MLLNENLLILIGVHPESVGFVHAICVIELWLSNVVFAFIQRLKALVFPLTVISLENCPEELLLSVYDSVKMHSTMKMDIKDVRQTVEKHLKDLGINGHVRIASAKFLNRYWNVVVVYSRDIEIDDRKQKTGIMAVLLIDDETGKVESFRENPT